MYFYVCLGLGVLDEPPSDDHHQRVDVAIGNAPLSILVVDDDEKIRALLRNVFEDAGFAVQEVATAAEVLSFLTRERPDLITLDLQLGFEDGLDVARVIRDVSSVPIVMVTGRGDVVDRVVGLELGADDYITKPFHIREVLARVRSVIRRSSGQIVDTQVPVSQAAVEMTQSPMYEFDGLRIIPERFELFDRTGKLCDLTSGDFRLLQVFLENAKRIMTRDRLMDLTGGVGWNPLDRTVDNQVARLRKKVERDPGNPTLIKTVRGVGYSFACDVTRAQSGLSFKSA